MSLFNIPAVPSKPKPKCIICNWLEKQDDKEQAHFEQLTKNYPLGTLHKLLKQWNILFSENTLRNHVQSNH